MAGKGFDFFRMAEEAMRVIEEIADAASAMSGEAEAPRNKQNDERKSGSSRGPFKPRSSRRSADKRTGRSEENDEEGLGLGGAAGLAGLAALGIAAYAQHEMHTRTPQGARRAKQHSENERVRKKKLAFERDLLDSFDRDAKAASCDRSSGFAYRNKLLEAKEVRIKTREAYLVVNPKDEPLLDPIKAERFFSPFRAAIKEDRREAVARMRRQSEALIEAWRESNPDDTAFERQLEARLQAKVKHDDLSSDMFLQRIEDLEAKLARIRMAVARGAAEAQATAADTRYLSIPAALELTGPRFEDLSKRMIQPRDKALAALFDNRIEGRIEATELEKALVTLEWTGTAVADVIERAILHDCVQDRLGFQSVTKMGTIGTFGMVSVKAVMNLPLKEVDLSGEDAARIAAALIADFERDTSYVFINLRTWAILAPVTGQMTDRLEDYLTRDEADGLFKRLEAAMIREIDEERRKRKGRKSRVFAPYTELLQVLAGIARVSRPLPALAHWNALLASRRAVREELLSTASAFWRPLLADIFDATRADHHKMGALEEKAYGLIKAAGAFDDAQQDVLAEQVSALLQRSGEIRLASCDDGWLTNVAGYASGDNIAIKALENLKSALALDPRERRAYFSPPTEPSNLGEFDKLLDAYKPKDRGNAIIEDEIGGLLNTGHVEEAERQLRDWIEKAPDGSVRDTVLATRLDDLDLSGWESFASLAALDEVGAIHAAFSVHCVYSLIDCGNSELPLEAGGLSTTCFDFAGTPLDEIRKIGRTYGTPWQGACSPTAHFGIDGLAPVLKALHTLSQVPRPTLTAEQKRLDGAVVQLAETWCFAAFAVKVYQAMQAHPLPRKKPVILGTHDFGLRIPEVVF